MSLNAYQLIVFSLAPINGFLALWFLLSNLQRIRARYRAALLVYVGAMGAVFIGFLANVQFASTWTGVLMNLACLIGLVSLHLDKHWQD